MRFQINAYVRGTMGKDEFNTDSIEAAFRVFDSFTIASRAVYIYDQVTLIEDGTKLVEEYRHWTDEVQREPRYQELLKECYPLAYPM